MSVTRATPPRRYEYQYAIHRIESEQLRFDATIQDDVDRYSRDLRARHCDQAEALRQAGAQLFGPDDQQGYPRYLRELDDIARPQLASTRGATPQSPPDSGAVDAHCGSTARPNHPVLRKTKTKGRDIAGRMMRVIWKNSDATGWTQREWACRLCCSPGTIGGLPCWKIIKLINSYHSRERAENADQSLVRPKGGRSRRPSNPR